MSDKLIQYHVIRRMFVPVHGDVVTMIVQVGDEFEGWDFVVQHVEPYRDGLYCLDGHWVNGRGCETILMEVVA